MVSRNSDIRNSDLKALFGFTLIGAVVGHSENQILMVQIVEVSGVMTRPPGYVPH